MDTLILCGSQSFCLPRVKMGRGSSTLGNHFTGMEHWLQFMSMTYEENDYAVVIERKR